MLMRSLLVGALLLGTGTASAGVVATTSTSDSAQSPSAVGSVGSRPDGSDCIRQLALVPADHGQDAHHDGAGALTVLDHRAGPTVIYDFTEVPARERYDALRPGPAYVLVLDVDSHVDPRSLARSVATLRLRFAVHIVRSCTTQRALTALRDEIHALYDQKSRSFSLATGICPALAVVCVIAGDPDFAESVRKRYGDRVRVAVGDTVAT